MYSETDIDAAVASGALTPAAAQALRDSVAASRQAPAVDEESFRLITGFNDIFVTIAAVLLLVAVGWIGFSMGSALFPIPVDFRPPDVMPFMLSPGNVAMGTALAGLAVAAASWGLAEYFTARRRMAFPSIVLLGSFVWGAGVTVFGVGVQLIGRGGDPRGFSLLLALVGLLSAGAALLHWRRFHVPITIAALTGALVGTALSLLLALVPQAQNGLLWLLLAAGLGVFAFAMWWDMADRTRTTRRSDVAFWLHLSAAPMIAHPIFNLIGVMDGNAGPAQAILVLILYALFGIVALAVDRRALLVSGLLYVLAALARLFDQAGVVGLNVALTALVIGSALLMLSAFWAPARRTVVTRLPGDVQARLPALHRGPGVRPT